MSSIPIMLLVFSNQSTKEMDMSNGVGGPFLQAALFCDKILTEQDGTLSAIRIIDRVFQTYRGPETIEGMPSVKINISVLVSLKSGDFKGKKELKITPKSPSGLIMPGFSGPILFEGDERGVNVMLMYGFDTKEEGLYWFDVELDGELITRMPLRIIYQKIQVTSSATQTIAPVQH